MKTVIRIVVISVLFVAAASAVTPKTPSTGNFDFVPFCKQLVGCQ